MALGRAGCRVWAGQRREGPRPLGFLDAVDGGNVGVVEAGENLRLPFEPGQPVRIRCESVGEDL